MKMDDIETQLKYIRYGAIGMGAFSARLVLDPKGALLQMAKRKELFEDDKDDRVIMARVSFDISYVQNRIHMANYIALLLQYSQETTRWAGVLLFALAAKTLSLAQTTNGKLTSDSKRTLQTFGAALVLDGIIVKLLGFHRSGVFNFIDSVGGGIVDIPWDFIYYSNYYKHVC